MSKRSNQAGSSARPPLQAGMTTKPRPATYPNVRVVFRPAADHGQLQKVAELVLADQPTAPARKAS